MFELCHGQPEVSGIAMYPGRTWQLLLILEILVAKLVNSYERASLGITFWMVSLVLKGGWMLGKAEID